MTNMNPAADDTIPFSAGQGIGKYAPNPDQHLDSLGRGAAGVRFSRGEVDTVDRSEPAEPWEPVLALPAPKPRMPDPGLARERWRQEVKHAAARWSLLTEGDLAALEAHEATLVDLVQTRHALARDEANRQVTSFVKDHQLFAL